MNKSVHRELSWLAQRVKRPTLGSAHDLTALGGFELHIRFYPSCFLPLPHLCCLKIKKKNQCMSYTEYSLYPHAYIYLTVNVHKGVVVELYLILKKKISMIYLTKVNWLHRKRANLQN